MTCVVNPAMGREFEWGAGDGAAVSRPKRVVVVGAGPAGLEAARAAAARGHQVVLLEASDRLGGQLALAGRQPEREAFDGLFDWYRQQLTHLQVEVRLQTRADAAMLGSLAADAIVIATGSKPSRDGFQRSRPDVGRMPGVDQGNVFAVQDVLEGAKIPGRRVLLLDDSDDWKGAGTALYLAKAGYAVSFVTKGAVVAKTLQLSHTLSPLRRRFRSLGVSERVQTAILEWGNGEASLKNLLTGTVTKEPFDALVLSTTNAADTALAEAVGELQANVYTVGDCVAPRTGAMAIFESRKLALTL